MYKNVQCTDQSSTPSVGTSTASFVSVSGVQTNLRSTERNMDVSNMLKVKNKWPEFMHPWELVLLTDPVVCKCVFTVGGLHTWEDSQQGASTCRCYAEPPDPLHSCNASTHLRVNGYNANVRVCRSQWILTENLKAMEHPMMNINQHMLYVGRNTLENIAKYHLGGNQCIHSLAINTTAAGWVRVLYTLQSEAVRAPIKHYSKSDNRAVTAVATGWLMAAPYLIEGNTQKPVFF